MRWRGPNRVGGRRTTLVLEMHLWCAVTEVGNMATWAEDCACDVACDVEWEVHDVTYLLIA
jgi:hypothetical protein